jgi:hypothetical protein
MVGSNQVSVPIITPHPDDDISLEPLSQSLSRITPSSKSVIIVGGDFNLGHMDWETLSVFPGKPNQKQHQELICHSYKYTTMTQTWFVWWSIGPVNSILILWEVFI